MVLKRESVKEFIEIFSAMGSYLDKNDHNFHNRLFMAYCNNCQSISAVGGDYTVFAGRDCGGDHYKTEKSPERCLSCSGHDFIKIHSGSLIELKKRYGNKTSGVLIEGIKKGLNRMDFPSLYNEDLPKIANRWKRLSKEKKRMQINKILRLNKKISESKKQVENLEEIILK